MSGNLCENIKINVVGHVTIDQFKSKDDMIKNNIEVTLLDEDNAIHFENMSYLIATALGHQESNYLYTMRFGNGGSVVNALGSIRYLQPNVVGRQITLYNQTYSKIIDQSDSGNLDPDNNRMDVSHILGNNFTDLTVSCLLDYNEPADQSPLDNDVNTNNLFNFDEIGLFDHNGYLCTHIIFAKIQKSLNRVIRVKYRLRITIVN